ncbi:MAG: hypothetical protein R3F07_04740 [Opitutaceae bacterium]
MIPPLIRNQRALQIFHRSKKTLIFNQEKSHACPEGLIHGLFTDAKPRSDPATDGLPSEDHT